MPSVVGRIVAAAPGRFEKTITLDHGSERGIKVGMPVVASDGLVGRVVQVSKCGCTVLLLDDPAFAVGVRMMNVRATGLAQGQAGQPTLNVTLGGPLAPSKLPRTHELAETSGQQGSVFPPGIPVGTVDTVKVSNDGLSIDVQLVLLVNVGDLEYVTVLLWPPSTALDSQRVHASLQLDTGSVQSGGSIGATVTFVNQTGVALRVPGCFSFFQVVIGDVHGPSGFGWLDCLQDFTIPIGKSSQPAKLWARPQVETAGSVPAYPPGRYYAFVVFDDVHPQVVAPAPVPIQVVGPVPTATTP